MSLRWVPLSSWSSAVVAALIGFGGTVPLVVRAMQVMGADAVQTASAVTALCLGIGVTGAVLTLLLRIPVVLAWSTPGAALLASSGSAGGWPGAIGAFVGAAIMMVVLGMMPTLGRWAARIPGSIASAMLAGVLLPFCLDLFRTMEADLLFVAATLAVFVFARQRFPLYALLLVLLVGLVFTVLRGDVAAMPAGSAVGMLAGTWPNFDAASFISLAVPLFLVTLVSQNLPGIAVLRSAGYAPSVRPLLLGTGVASLAAAPFGAHGVNLAAITAAICTSDDAHPEPERRWIVGVIYAGCYLLLALFSAPLVRLFIVMPHSTIAALTGIALVIPLAGALEGALEAPAHRDAAILTLAATASGVTLWGIGSAFWGLAVGFAALAARAALQRRSVRTGNSASKPSAAP